MDTCSCAGIQRNTCSCAILSNTCHYVPSNSNIIFVPNKRNLDQPREKRKPSMLRKILQEVYDMCVGYNIRYCALTGGYSKDTNIKHALNDWILLICFLVTNTVVLLALLTRVTYHMSSIIFNLISWTQRALSKSLKIYLDSDCSQKGKKMNYSLTSAKYKYCRN